MFTEEGARVQQHHDTKGTLSTLNGSAEGWGKRGAADSNQGAASPGGEIPSFSTMLQKTLDERFFGGGKKSITLDVGQSAGRRERSHLANDNASPAAERRRHNIVINEGANGGRDVLTPIVMKKKLNNLDLKHARPNQKSPRRQQDLLKYKLRSPGRITECEDTGTSETHQRSSSPAGGGESFDRRRLGENNVDFSSTLHRHLD